MFYQTCLSLSMGKYLGGTASTISQRWSFLPSIIAGKMFNRRAVFIGTKGSQAWGIDLACVGTLHWLTRFSFPRCPAAGEHASW
jgi:hypothetical protein